MMKLHYTATEAAAASLPTQDRPFDVSLVDGPETPERRKAWLICENVSPHLIQILDEQGTVLGIVWPWSEKVITLRPANARRIVQTHWVSKLSAAANTAQGVWLELTTVEPIPFSVQISS
jgi:hypothetical protein